MRGEAPRSLSVSVADMGPEEGVGDALVSDDDVVLLYNGDDHYNGLVASSVADARVVVVMARGTEIYHEGKRGRGVRGRLGRAGGEKYERGALRLFVHCI